MVSSMEPGAPETYFDKRPTPKQQNLVITRGEKSEITVDNIEVAQFIYLLLHNEKIRDVIDTVGKKVRSCWAASQIRLTAGRMARFIIANLTDPSSIPKELAVAAGHARRREIGIRQAKVGGSSLDPGRKKNSLPRRATASTASPCLPLGGIT